MEIPPFGADPVELPLTPALSRRERGLVGAAFGWPQESTLFYRIIPRRVVLPLVAAAGILGIIPPAPATCPAATRPAAVGFAPARPARRPPPSPRAPRAEGTAAPPTATPPPPPARRDPTPPPARCRGSPRIPRRRIPSRAIATSNSTRAVGRAEVRACAKPTRADLVVFQSNANLWFRVCHCWLVQQCFPQWSFGTAGQASSGARRLLFLAGQGTHLRRVVFDPALRRARVVRRGRLARRRGLRLGGRANDRPRDGTRRLLRRHGRPIGPRCAKLSQQAFGDRQRGVQRRGSRA